MNPINIDRNKIFASILVFLIIINPSIFTVNQFFYSVVVNSRPTPAQSENEFKIGVMGLVGDWDMAITDGENILYNYYRINSLEPLIWQHENSLEPKPQLATTWDYELWPEEHNSLGFNNTGGVKAIDITLRNGVKFHDGSDWNATVAKWNIDRLFIITGNLTGNGDLRNQDNYWKKTEKNKPYFTLSWNLSEYDADGIGFSPTDYSYYYINETTKIYNPNPYGGYDSVSGLHFHYAPYDMFPIIRHVKIIEEQQSGGKIRVEFNDWNSQGILSLKFPMISIDSYKDYMDKGIYGYENSVLDPKNPTIVDHMIGTGPYLYVEHDQAALPPRGYMLKNENYWNRTALEAQGWFDADRVSIYNFELTEMGKDGLNTAFLVHFLDYAQSNMYFPLDYNAIIANPNIKYTEKGVIPYINQITLNCINETWWSGEPSAEFGWVDINSWYPSEQGYPGGVPRKLREAISFAFNYDLYIHTLRNDRVVRAGGLLGTDNVYYNSSTPLADYNLTKAREILLFTEDDPDTFTYDQTIYNFSKICADRSLDVSSTNAAWQDVADNNPIFVLDFYWDTAHEDEKWVLQNSLRNIGVALKDRIGNTNRVSTIIWDIIRMYWGTTFDGSHSIWSANAWVMDYPMSVTNPEDWVEANYGDPNHGTWRTPTYSVTDQFPWWNLAFCYDTEIDDWLGRIAFSNTTENQYWINKITEKVQTDLYPMLYISQEKYGVPLWRDWEMNFNRGDLFFANFRFVPYPPISIPGIFSLFSDAEAPDTDGNFNLNWSSSSEAQNYSLYRHNNLITEINGSVSLLVNQTATSPISITGLSSGEYYYVVVAHNLLGDRMSNNVHIIVDIPAVPSDPEISGYNSLILIGLTFGTSLVLLIKKKQKEERNRRKKSFYE
ncbi:MAG: hypothetical protein KAX18_01725 [Candidatus Lokiarchaeota archaeon]|nr:hypothetical protein [Candidatus Lokiarchaeota archaeon]